MAFGYDAIFGYQFNSHLQLGGGIGLRGLSGEVTGDGFGVPLYADFKVNFLKTKVTPFFDLKAGSLITSDPTFYFSPSVGVKIHFSKARALSISTGVAWAECEEYDYYYDYGDLPVINTDVVISRPYSNGSVSVVKDYYDYKGDSSSQENSIVYYGNTYMQNSGVDYGMSEAFEVVSILDGTVMEVLDDEINHIENAFGV